MLNLILIPEVVEDIASALRRSGSREIGGILMGEHSGPDEFKVTKITIQKIGGISHFLRIIEDALGKLNAFFKQSNNDYSRFNYIGEWHSHPLFSPYPSSQDDESMLEIIMDDGVGANFVVLLIVKLGPDAKLIGTAHTYLPNGSKSQSQLILES
ncbi:Mov34/MPN/PAD-1 family protein [Methylophilus luteus]|uniref:Mov34/MPN/PAD-1 family protein n=1 Tax=Methylophilus luteus TaxID=640108 RepID=A0ABW3F2Q9_9PROT